MQKMTVSRKIFLLFNYILLGLIAFLCLLPLINVLAVSFSSSSAAAAGFVKLWPVDFTIASYKHALTKREFMEGLYVSVQRVVLGYVINMAITILIAYPLSKETSVLRSRNVYAWFFIITMLFHGGLIPSYMTMKALGLLDTIWALVLPGAVHVFNMILLLNFFRNLPKEIEEAAYIDGAGHWKVLWSMYIPLSKPALATITLFTVVMHWNSWFDGLIYMNSPSNYPLQSYLQTIIVNPDSSTLSSTELYMSEVSDRTFKAAQVFLAAFPILIFYPFLQKYFMKGLVMGSVKG
ncbi:carbohydrate ABC transporter permease [Paenibacillus sp. GCM10023248]|uniref:carbohydrate ABC transporter permease n=1 Tax=Bacillales TaxID=1385 RepID=UPI00237930C1|nr:MULTISPECIES: carbohydrate ABC transporter permease [Bacillales]MDD9271576.1 carbohydrate ABC transporter permease [Paenibacillus sp. MAHUQ-63]MDR6884069.1 putative aldouronate transport system permease protein [Bacillus sp. 3255]